MKKITKIFTLLFIIITVSACSNVSEDNGVDMSKYNTKDFSLVECTRDAVTEDDSSVDIKYKVYYDKDEYIQIILSTQKVTSTDSSVLDQYEEAYNNVYSVYDDLDYYDNVVTRDEDSVTTKTYINYGKVDMDKLMEIEGTDNNVEVTDGKIKLSDWKNFAKKYGTSCK